MAEARAAVNTLRVGTLSLEQVTSAAKLRGVQVHGIDGGLLIVIPSVKFLWRQLVGRIRYIGQNFQTLCWPAPVWGVLVTIALFTAVVALVCHFKSPVKKLMLIGTGGFELRE